MTREERAVAKRERRAAKGRPVGAPGKFAGEKDARARERAMRRALLEARKAYSAETLDAMRESGAAKIPGVDT